MVAANSDFVMTIEDDDENFKIAEEEEEEEVIEEEKKQPEPEAPSKKKRKAEDKKKEKKEKKKAKTTAAAAATASTKKNSVNDEFDSGFTFAIDGGGSAGPAHAWDFTAAKSMLKEAQPNSVPRTDIDVIIAKKRQETKDAKKKKAAAAKETDEDGAMVADDDEDLALDGFGAGAVDTEQNEQEDEDENSDTDDDDDESASDMDEYNASDADAEKDAEAVEARKRAYFAPEEENKNDEQHDAFTSMNLSRPILKGLANVGFVKPTEIQTRTIPLALLGKDICGGAVTGSGKTAAFIVPILERLLYRPRQTAATRVLILCPTRELAAQVHSVAAKLGGYTDITFCLCVGGLNLKRQEAELKNKPDVVVATPGRLIDHVRNSAGFALDTCEILVMDEADRMLEDGFAEELGEIVKACPKSRQTMLFSATMTDNVDQLIRMSLNHPARLFVDRSNQAASRLVQEFVRIRAHREADRSAVLVALCRRTFKARTIIFFKSKVAAHQMKILFGLLGLNAGELHGNLTQEQRLEALERFRDNKVDFLMATDLASRGLDIKGIDVVINYNMPNQFAQYLHRVGRTARAGRNGRSVTLVGESDRKMLKMAIKSANAGSQVKNRVVPAEAIQKYKKKVEKLTPQIEEILQEEKEERALRNAEMQLQKGENLIRHSTDIYSRPARTWFKTNKEKKVAASAAHKKKK